MSGLRSSTVRWSIMPAPHTGTIIDKLSKREDAMKNLYHEYLESVIALLKRIDQEEESAVYEAARLMVDAIQDGKNIFAFGCTHSSIPIQDLVYRAGGLMLINPIFGPGIASLDVLPATLSSGMEQMTGYAKVILD